MWRFLLLLCVLLSACTVSHPLLKENSALPKLSFNEELANLPEGATRYFAQSPLGAVQVRAGEFYLSGLGNRCRFVYVEKGSEHRKLALCEEKMGGWHLVPSIFESLTR